MSPRGRERAGGGEGQGRVASTVTPLSPPPVPYLPELHDFLATVSALVAGHERLLTLLHRERQLVIDGDVDALIPCLSEKEEALSSLVRLERRRQDEFAQLRPLVDPSVSVDRMRELIPLVPEPCRTELAAGQRRLDVLTAAIVDINQINGRLVGRALEQIASMLGTLTQLASPAASYGATGRLSRSPAGGRSFGKG